MSASYRYVALLRGINIGGHRLQMAELRKLFESFGCADVTTYIQTGNVLFGSVQQSAERLTAVLEQKLVDALGYAPAVFVLRPADLSKVIAQSPFSTDEMADDVKRYVSFLPRALTAAEKRAIEALEVDGESYYAGDRVIYTAFRGPTLDSAMGKGLLEKTLKAKLTVRNWAVTCKLAELAAG